MRYIIALAMIAEANGFRTY